MKQRAFSETLCLYYKILFLYRLANYIYYLYYEILKHMKNNYTQILYIKNVRKIYNETVNCFQIVLMLKY